MRIGLDAMGGDRGTAEVVAGAIAGCAFLDADDTIVLVGKPDAIESAVDGTSLPDQVEIVPASQAVGMGESPVEGLRSKPDSSIAKLAVLHKDGDLDACISAGNTGACVAAAQMRLGRLSGVQRPGIAVVVPSLRGPVMLCDVGANVNCRPQHLYQYAVMASLYTQAILPDMDNPRVGLLSVGEEEGKGNELVKKASELLKDDERINYVGNVESRDLIRNVCDVMVCEGFVGNVVLKLVEGLGEALLRAFLDRLVASIPQQGEEIMSVAGTMADSYDFNKYGGAPLLGVDGIWIICHGASSCDGLANAVRSAKEFSKQQVNRAITDRLAER